MTGAIFLWLPISHPGKSVSFIDCLFVGSSAFSNTGLSTVDVAATFNWFGKFITFILINVGGIGWFTLKIFVITYILKKKTNRADIAYGETEVGTVKKQETLGLVFSLTITSFGSTLIFGTVFGFLFATQAPNDVLQTLGSTPISSVTMKGHWGTAFLTGYYHAAASINNLGLDIIQGNVSIGPYSGNYTIQVFTLFLFVLGGVGFGVVYDIYRYLRFKAAGKAFNFSLLTKISVVSYFAIAAVGLSITYIAEGARVGNDNSHAFLGTNHFGSIGTRLWALAFNSFSTRNAGFSTMNVNELSGTSKLVFSILMYIGAGPGSTAGGLRTTTTAVLLISFIAKLRGKTTTTVFKRQIPDAVTSKAAMNFFFSLTLLIVAFMLVSIIQNPVSATLTDGTPIQNNITEINVLFVVASAFGTTGLSTCDLSHFTIAPKIILILLMFMGRMGISTTMAQFASPKAQKNKNFAEEGINLG